MIRLVSAGRPATREEIEDLEREIGARFPSEYREHLLNTNVAEPEPNFFAVGEKQRHGGLRVLFGVTAEAEKDLRTQWRKHEGRLPSGSLPVGDSEGGNLVCLDMKTGAVLFWDHEAFRGRGQALEQVAPSFAAFLQLLRPQDVELDPSDVKEAWIDPDFLASLRKKEN